MICSAAGAAVLNAAAANDAGHAGNPHGAARGGGILHADRRSGPAGALCAALDATGGGGSGRITRRLPSSPDAFIGGRSGCSGRKRELEREIAEATASEDVEQGQRLVRAMEEVQLELHRMDKLEAIIEGFGVLSGRVKGPAAR